MNEYIQAASGFMRDRFLFGTAYPLCPLVEYTKWFLQLPIKPEIMEGMVVFVKLCKKVVMGEDYAAFRS